MRIALKQTLTRIIPIILIPDWQRLPGHKDPVLSRMRTARVSFQVAREITIVGGTYVCIYTIFRA